MTKDGASVYALRRLAFAVCVVLAGVLVVATPASAHSAAGSWSSNHMICQSCSVNRGNIVMMWQIILVSANATTDTCRSFADGQFGPKTAAATRTWQAWHGLAADAQVGPKTWGKAQSLLAFDVTAGDWDWYTYNGGRFPVTFRQNRFTLVWEFAPPSVGDSGWNDTGHPGIGPWGCDG
jgi:Putative peptidoglycan binding domain